ncbi:MAG: hypothetical protein HUU26_06050 [Gemmatimonadaceae bacterium]|nr:hypothetical protein [Gemmatimonadaceae bacterium]
MQLAVVALAFALEAEAQREPPCGLPNGPACLAPGVELTALAAGQAHSCGLARNGAAYCWGDGRNGELGNGDTLITRFPVPVEGNRRYVAIGAGGAFSCALSRAGEVFCWGRAQTVPGWPHAQRSPVLVPFAGAVTMLAVGLRHACVLDRDRQAHCWGWNVDGEAGVGSAGLERPTVPAPAPVAGGLRFAAISAGGNFTCAIDPAGAVWCWGSNADGILGASAPERCGDVDAVPCATRPVRIPLPETMSQVSSGMGHACALGITGRAWCWGTNGSGQLGFLGRAAIGAPREVPAPEGDRFAVISSGGLGSCALTVSRQLHCWGADLQNMGGQVRHPDDYAPRRVGTGRYAAVAVGRAHHCALESGGALSCWGDTILGALGRR